MSEDPPPSGRNETTSKYCGIGEGDTSELPIHEKPGLPETTLTICGTFGQGSQVFVGDIKVLIGEFV